MAHIDLDQAGVSHKIIDNEIEIGKDQAIQEGKQAELAEKRFNYIAEKIG